jgi:hypothetical protein
MTCPPASGLTFLALALMIVFPTLTWPSPATTTLPPLRTDRIVVPCQAGAAAFVLIHASATNRLI